VVGSVRFTEGAHTAAPPFLVPLPNAAASETEGPVLDVNHLEEMKDLFASGPGGFYGQMMKPYVALTEQHLKDLARSLEIGDIPSVRAIAHTLKG
jgi:hypothetical protein